MFSDKMNLSTKIILLAFFLVVVATTSSIFVFAGNFSARLEHELANRALAIARTVALIPEIRDNVNISAGHQAIQPIAERIRLSTGSAYIVILGMDKKRYSHPLQERIGQPFEAVDSAAAFQAEEVISRAAGVAGPAVRAFAPILTDDGATQVGVVLVGILSPTFIAILADTSKDISFSLLAGLLAGIAGSLLLAGNIKKIMFNLEPSEIARMLEERTAVFHSIDDGIIAINQENRISVINNRAKSIFKLRENVLGKVITDVIPTSRLPETAGSGKAQYNQMFIINNTTILANRIPIWVDGKIAGAVSTFKDKTEVHRLAEELTGIKNFIEALRVQNHENINKLHTIAGLIQLGKEEEALDFIFKVIANQQELTGFLTENIKDYSVAGLILGKYNRALELKVNMQIDRKSRLFHLPRHLDSSALIVIIGNLLENAFDAVMEKDPGERRVFFTLQDNHKKLIIRIKDNGPGIDEELQEEIYKKGFTTKGKNGRGLGLYLVKEYVDNGKGTISFSSGNGEDTSVTVSIPME